MKNFLLILLLFSIGLISSSYALPGNLSPTMAVSPDTGRFQLVIAFEIEDSLQQVEFNFKSAADLQGFDNFDFAEAMINTGIFTSVCTIDITVTVRIGLDSNFIQASASARGISCSKVGGVIRHLRQQLMDAIK